MGQSAFLLPPVSYGNKGCVLSSFVHLPSVVPSKLLAWFQPSLLGISILQVSHRLMCETWLLLLGERPCRMHSAC